MGRLIEPRPRNGVTVMPAILQAVVLVEAVLTDNRKAQRSEGEARVRRRRVGSAKRPLAVTAHDRNDGLGREVPPPITEVIGARIRALTEQARRALMMRRPTIRRKRVADEKARHIEGSLGTGHTTG